MVLKVNAPALIRQGFDAPGNWGWGEVIAGKRVVSWDPNYHLLKTPPPQKKKNNNNIFFRRKYYKEHYAVLGGVLRHVVAIESWPRKPV